MPYLWEFDEVFVILNCKSQDYSLHLLSFFDKFSFIIHTKIVIFYILLNPVIDFVIIFFISSLISF